VTKTQRFSAMRKFPVYFDETFIAQCHSHCCAAAISLRCHQDHNRESVIHEYKGAGNAGNQQSDQRGVGAAGSQ
jgi:hypothetical protein